MSQATAEITQGERFAFGANWARFLRSLDETRIAKAEASLKQMLGVERLEGLRFLDAGSGSGLFSLAARRLGAAVHSFDYDPQSVACTRELRRRYYPDDKHWQVEQGSVLDPSYLDRLGRFDIVYSWGVLHHTGAMLQGLEYVVPLVAKGGRLFIAIYNDQCYKTRRWAWIKRTYNQRRWLRPILIAYGLVRAWGLTMLLDLYHLRPFVSWRQYGEERGMSPWWDVVDWIGGWPYEAATPEFIFRFYRDRGFRLQELVIRQGYGCNEFVLFIRSLDAGGAERQLAGLAKGLQGRGASVRVLTFYPGGSLRPELEASGVPVEDLGKRGRWDVAPFIWRLNRRLRALEPAVLYAWLPTANSLAALVGRMAGVPRIVWGVRASNVDFGRYDWLIRLDFLVTRLTAPLVDRIVCNSEAGRSFHARHGYPERKMCVIENGIDTDYFRFDPEGRMRRRVEWKVGAREILIGLVARLDPMKDHETFLRAATRLARERNDVKFVCVGDGRDAYRTPLHSLATELEQQRRILWAGARRDMPAVYSAFDISSSSSYGEGFSNAIAEAMSCERPCVVTDIGDSARIVGETGWVVPPRNPEALAKAWSAMLSLTPAARAELGRRARRRIEAEFSVSRMVDKTWRVLAG